MEGEDLFEGLDANFLEEGASEGTLDIPGFDAATGEVYGTEKEKDPGEEPDLQKELSFVQSEDNEEEVQSNEEDIDEDAPDSEESPSSPLTSLTSALREDGVLSSLSDEELKEIKSGSDLIKVIRKQIENNEYSDLSEDQKEYLKALRNGVPEDSYRQAQSSSKQLADISPYDLEGEDKLEFRRKVLTQDFLVKGFEQAEAEKYAERSIDLGEDVEDSKKALARLQKVEKDRLAKLSEEAEARNKEAQDNYQKKLNELKTKVLSTSEVIPNIKVNEETQNKVYDLMTKTAGYDRNNNPVSAVVKSMIEDQDYLVKLNYLHHLTDGFKSWDALTGPVSNSAVNKLDRALAAQDAKIKQGVSGKSGKKSSGLLGALDNII
jgi:hypothetical protein